MANLVYMKSILLSLACIMAACVAITGCNDEKKPSTPPAEAKTSPPAAVTEEKKETKPTPVKEVAVIKTSAGEMVAEFWPEVAPKTVENFITLSKKGFYDGTAFHRIIKDFMIQGGDPNTKDPSKEALYGSGGPGYSIKAEFNDRKHVKGVLSMARTEDPDSAGSQFFICLAAVPHLDHAYTAFGKLIKGEDVLEALGNTPVRGGSRPVQRASIESIKIVPADSIK
jgi:peptidyl-prolyl cis-trans isomerase B (cyclophilin B)